MNGIKLEDVLNKNVAINFKYESDYVKYLNYLAKHNISWSLGAKANSKSRINRWKVYGENFCISLATGKIKYGAIRCFEKDLGYKIIKYEEKINNINNW